jgi:membrane protease YdiL (CAAX protease family)
LLYYAGSLLLLALYQQFGHGYWALLGFDALLSAGTLALALGEPATMRGLLRADGLRWPPMLAACAAAVGIGLGVGLLADYLAEAMSQRQQEISFIFWETPYPRALSVVFICLLPAIVEEVGYRGLVLGWLQALSARPWQAMAGSAALFSLLHWSLLAWLWLFPLGLVLAYCRFRYGTLWYGIFAHFAYNFAILAVEWWP